MSTPFVGDILEIENLNVSGYPKPVITYQWLRDGDVVSGASGSTYEVSFNDVGQVVSVMIYATNPYGVKIKTLGYEDTEGVLELPYFVQQPYFDTTAPPKEQVPFYIYGIDLFGGFPEPNVTYRWYRDGVIIPNENESNYTPTAVDVGSIISAEIILSNLYGTVNTIIDASEPVEQADLYGTYASINPPVFTESYAEIISDIIGYDTIEYRWQVDLGSGFETFSASPIRAYIPAEYEGRLIRCSVTAIRSGQGQLDFTTLPSIIQIRSTGVDGSAPQQGVLIPGSGYIELYEEKGSQPYVGNDDLFASESHAIFGLGLPEYYIFLDETGFTLDMYAFHGSNIDKVLVSCDGGDEVVAGFEQEGPNLGEGYFYVHVDKNNFTAGATYEIRATAYPVNGYTRSKKMILTYPDGENKVQIGTNTSIRQAYETLYESYDPYKRNIIELTESGEYEVGARTPNTTGKKHDSGWIEIIAPEDVNAYIDFSDRGKDRIARPTSSIRPFINAERYVNVTFKNKISDYDDIYAPSWNRYYIEDDEGTRFWLDGCTSESDWFSGGYWEMDNPAPAEKGGFRFGGGGTSGKKKKVYVTNSYFNETAGGPIGVDLAKNTITNYAYKDAYTNVKHCIKSKSYNKLNPVPSARHADHYQLFTNWETSNPPFLVENNILYGYYGQDYSEGVQPFGTFGTGRETYRDWAIVNCTWDCGPNATLAQIGLTYGNILMIGLDIEKSIAFRSDAYAQIGPILLRGINSTGTISNGFLNELEAFSIRDTANGFRTENVNPEVIFNGIPGPEYEYLLTTYYEWYISPENMASVEGMNTYIGDADGTNTTFLIGVTANGFSGDEIIPTATREIFKTTDDFTGRLAYWNETSSLTTMTITGIRDLESAIDFENEQWYASVLIDRGKMNSKRIKRRTDSKTCDFGWGTLFAGITATSDDIFNSTTGVTFQLRSVLNPFTGQENEQNHPRWVIPPTANVLYPVPGSLLIVEDGTYEGSPTPTITYQWKKDLSGGSNYTDISGANSYQLNLTTTPIRSGASIRCEVKLTNSVGIDIVNVDFGRVSDWNTYKDGIYRFPTPYDNTPRSVVQIESSVVLPGVSFGFNG